MYPQLKTRLVKPVKRRGRGVGSGRGKTAGRGHKGQLARTGSKIKPFFESGHTELWRRLPKLGGFRRHWVARPVVINIQVLSQFQPEETVDLATLQAKGLVPKTATSFKILSTGEIKQALTIATNLFSAAAKKKLNAAGCKFIEPAKAAKETTPAKSAPRSKKKTTN
jgi:large subunit ribosomal protein L15